VRITRYTDYSLRVLLFVALKDKQISTIGEIADAYGISKNHLRKVVHELSVKGYLLASRGKNGGMYLKGAPEDINIGAVVRDLEQDLEIVECFGDATGCVLTPACELKKAFGNALQAFFSCLDGYTLADLLPGKNRPQILRLLGMDPVNSVTIDKLRAV
jgi:Rrf2 family nitric oxide-sensitive transcriptional repressor